MIGHTDNDSTWDKAETLKDEHVIAIENTNKARQPLEGIRIPELAMYHAGRGASAILGDLGAEVIKIGQPKIGDPVRTHDLVGRIRLNVGGGVNLWHEGANRNKKSITIDLKNENGREIVYRLVGQSDVFLTSLLT